MITVEGLGLNVQIPGYEIGEQIGAGGFAVVRAGVEVASGDTVAIKIAKDALLGEDAEGGGLFGQEVAIQRRLKHPNIVPVIASGIVEDQTIHGTARYPFSIMPQASCSLQDLLNNNGGTLPPESVVTAIDQIAAGLDYAHRSHVLHRDVKPPNVLILDGQDLKDDGRCALTDFGIAATAHRLHTTHIITRQLLAGTRGYTALEQFAGLATVPSDVYSLGSVATRALTGSLPYVVTGVQITEHGDNYYGQLAATQREPFDRHVQMTDVLSEMEPVVAQAVDFRPERRPQTAGEFADKLKEAYFRGTALQSKHRVALDLGTTVSLNSDTYPFRDGHTRRRITAAIDESVHTLREVATDGTALDDGTTIGTHNLLRTVVPNKTVLDDTRNHRSGHLPSNRPRIQQQITTPHASPSSSHQHRNPNVRGWYIGGGASLAIAAIALGSALSAPADKDGGTKHRQENRATATADTTLPANYNCHITGVREISSGLGEFDVRMSQPDTDNLLAVTTAEHTAIVAVAKMAIPKANTSPVFMTYSIRLSEPLYSRPLTISTDLPLPENAYSTCIGKLNFGTSAVGDETIVSN